MPILRRSRFVALVSLVAAGSLAVACQEPEPESAQAVRGPKMKVARLSTDAEAAVYVAALAASFDPGSGLVALLHPRRLPRTAGLAGGREVPANLVEALRKRGVIQGTCEPPAGRDTPTCDATAAGYVIRGSNVFQGVGDTVQFHLAVERYQTATSGPQEALRFEKIYQLVPRGERWRVAREARAPESTQ